MERIIEKEIDGLIKKIKDGLSQIDRLQSPYSKSSKEEIQVKRQGVQALIVELSHRMEKLLEEIEDYYHSLDYNRLAFRDYIERILNKYKNVVANIENLYEDLEEDAVFIENYTILSLNTFPKELWFYKDLSSRTTLTLYGLVVLYKGWMEQLIGNIQQHVLNIAKPVFSRKDFYNDQEEFLKLIGLKRRNSEGVILPVQEEEDLHLSDRDRKRINDYLAPFKGTVSSPNLRPLKLELPTN